MNILLFILLRLSVSNASALVADNLIDAVIHVESRGNINAHNVGEDAVGVLQIRPIMVQEVNRVLGVDKYTLMDRWNKQKSIEMFNVIRQNTPNPTNEKIARNWNGGPNGYNKNSTLKYWQKVKKQL